MSSLRKAGAWTPAGGLSLFPFLAVLICVMGGLIVLLVVLARHGRVQAFRAAQAAAGQKKLSLQQLQQQRELLRWEAEQIRQSRAETEAQLAEARLQLSGAEDHLRRLRAQWQELQQAWQAAEQSLRESADVDQLQQRLNRLQAEIVRLQHQVAQKRPPAQKPKTSYAIVPYAGPHGTQRRPIYIECRQDRIILQPEGIVLTPKDFEGPMEQENPLARAVRAVREYWANQAAPGPKAQEPYPLLLVRPDGIVAYYMAREALQEWGSEFGYELIGQDWQLRFPPPDPRLAQILQEEVELARARQQLLAKIAPRVARRAKLLDRLGPQGIELQEATSGQGGSGLSKAQAFHKASPAHRRNRKAPQEQRGQGAMGSASAGSGVGSSEGFSGLAASGASPSSAPNHRADPPQRAARGGSSLALPTGRLEEHPEDSSISGQAGSSSGAGRAGWGPGRSKAPTGGEGGPGAFGSQVPWGLTGSPARVGPAGAGPASAVCPNGLNDPSGLASGDAVGGFGASLPPGAGPEDSFSATRAWIPPAPSGAVVPQPEQSGPASSSPKLRPGEWYDRPPRLASQPSSSAPSVRDLDPYSRSPARSAQQLRAARGRNWALPGATDKAIPITRPIFVDCYPDRLVIAPGDAQQKEILLAPKTLESLDELVGAIWEHIESWGIAGRGMYWRPVLSIRVAPGAEGRFQDLQTLLEESGLLIERRQ